MALSPSNRRVAIILVIVLGLGLVMCLICGTFGAFQSSRWFDQMIEQGQQTVAEADAFASTHDDTACLDAGLSRSDACGPTGLSCLTQVSVFLDRCFQSAHPTAGLCDGVPEVTAFTDSARWAHQTCDSHGRPNDPQCPQLAQSIQRACAQRGRH
jgi:hypothetical protein